MPNIFDEEIKPKEILKDLTKDELRKLAKKDEITTEFGSASYVTKVRSRSAKFTKIIYDEPTKEDEAIIRQALDYIKTKRMIMVERRMCLSSEINLLCRYYVTEDYARNAYMWHQTLFDPTEKKNPDITVISIPEWPERKVLVSPKTKKTFVFGSDYTGEIKKANLRLAMYIAKQKGWLGLHAGSKVIRVKRGNDLVEKGILMFGLSGTGKTTLTCHHHYLEPPEGVVIRQDDVVFLKEDGYAIGTEDNFYMKTEGLSPKSDPLLYKVVTSPNAILENIWVEPNGQVDFLNYTYTSNGRAVVMRREMDFTDNSIDLSFANIFIFIFRRNDIVPPVAKLTCEQGAAFFMLGESVETSAGDPTQAGKSKRVVGTNPFIIGPEDEEGNRFLSILSRHKDMEVYVINTGRIGGESGEKITVLDTTTIIKEIARGDIEWQVDPDWNYLVPKTIPGINWERFNPHHYYSAIEYKKRVQLLKKERKDYLSGFKNLRPEIRDSLG
uniref:phosphoenolpyruvate carboxykinase (ATP) n=1 Tax=candidate division WOR-3 bacterium TaxID=2052148 RepID=A0A7C6AAW1_UNCW3